jgi:hypothetical protein
LILQSFSAKNIRSRWQGGLPASHDASAVPEASSTSQPDAVQNPPVASLPAICNGFLTAC